MAASTATRLVDSPFAADVALDIRPRLTGWRSRSLCCDSITALGSLGPRLEYLSTTDPEQT